MYLLSTMLRCSSKPDVVSGSLKVPNPGKETNVDSNGQNNSHVDWLLVDLGRHFPPLSSLCHGSSMKFLVSLLHRKILRPISTGTELGTGRARI